MTIAIIFLQVLQVSTDPHRPHRRTQALATHPRASESSTGRASTVSGESTARSAFDALDFLFSSVRDLLKVPKRPCSWLGASNILPTDMQGPKGIVVTNVGELQLVDRALRSLGFHPF